MGRFLIIAGLVLLLLGALVQYAPGLFGWFGRLPGDIRIEGERGRVFIPLTSMILISIVATVLINLFRR
ncbi:MAG TPA: DUF2905 domain-containing protein [Gammaproteobacteria bacterium]|nr:DUF2905 domain-containing protein [Gammaproteobacteria bacterium]